MLIEGNGGGREPFKPPPARKSAPASKAQPALRPHFQLQTQQQAQPQAQQQSPLATPSPFKKIDFSTWNTGADLFKQKSLSVQVAPEQKSLSVQVAPQQPAVAQSPDHGLGDGGWMDGTFPTSPWVIDKREADQKKQDERLLKRTEYEAADRSETAVEMTPKQWASLSPQQQASAQWNYDLSLAVKRDFDSQGKNKADAGQTKNYNARVKELFGEEESLGYKGLDFAPNTIAFLDSRDIKAADLAGHSLDDILSGNSLVTMDTFNGIEEQVKTPDVFHTQDARGKNIQFAQQIAKGQLAYQEDLASKLKQGERLLTSITSDSTNAAANKSYGAALQTTEHTPLTGVRPETLAQFDIYMEALARTDSPIDQALQAITADLNERGASPSESAQVWQGLTERSRQAMNGEGKWFEGIEFPMRSPVEVAQALGAPTLKRQATLGAK